MNTPCRSEIRLYGTCLERYLSNHWRQKRKGKLKSHKQCCYCGRKMSSKWEDWSSAVGHAKMDYYEGLGKRETFFQPCPAITRPPGDELLLGIWRAVNSGNRLPLSFIIQHSITDDLHQRAVDAWNETEDAILLCSFIKNSALLPVVNRGTDRYSDTLNLCFMVDSVSYNLLGTSRDLCRAIRKITDLFHIVPFVDKALGVKDETHTQL